MQYDIFVERKNAFFYICIFNRTYADLLEKATGFRFTKQAYVARGNLVTFYKLKDELEQCKVYYRNLVEKKDSRLSLWFSKGLEVIKKRDELIELFKKVDSDYIVKHYDQILEQLYQIYLHHTALPYLILSSLDQEKHQDIIKFFEEFRKESLNPLHEQVLEKIWKAAEKITGINYQDFSYFTPDELGRIFKGQDYPDQKEIEKRKQSCVFYDQDDKIVFNYDPDYSKKLGIKEIDASNIEELKGEIACQGKARGKVCIVNKPYEMSKFKPGNILVSINTTPDLMPVLAKSSAIVTDEGGIMCHAAIVSRELNVPCIIGTKYATRFLKDGDEIEVNAAKGIVRKLYK